MESSTRNPETADKSGRFSLRGKYLNSYIIQLLMVAVVGLIAYSNTFHVPFVFDDTRNIVENPLIKNYGYFISPSEAADAWEDDYIQFRSRIIGYFTFALNHSIHGLNVTGYHVFNFAVHLLNAVCVYLLVLITFRTPFFEGYSDERLAVRIAFFSSLFFVSHPLQTQAVTYVVQRFASLATLFYLAAFLFYIRSRLASRIPRRYAFYMLALFFALFSLKTKELAVSLPFTIAVYEFMFFRGSPKRRILYLMPLILLLITVPLSYMDPNRTLLEASKVQSSVSWLDYLLTQLAVMVTYMRLLILPVNQNLDYDYPVYSSFFNPDVLVSLLFILFVLAFGLWILLRSRHKGKELRLAAFGIFWFFITLLPESGLIPIVDVIFEHRVYLPSVGAFVAIVSLVSAAAHGSPERTPLLRKIVPALLLTISLLLCIATYKRNNVWQTEEGLWEDVVKKSPLKSRGYMNLGDLYERSGLLDEATKYHKIAVRLELIKESIKRYELSVNLEAEKEMEGPESPELEHKLAYAHFKLGKAYMEQGLFEKAIEEFERAIVIKPDYAKAYVNLGMLYGKTGKYDMSIKYSERALSIEPSIEAYNNLGMAYRMKGDSSMADDYFRKAEALRAAKE